MRHVTHYLPRAIALHGSAVLREVPHARARVCGLFSAVVVFCRERAAKSVPAPRGHLTVSGCRTLAHGLDGTLLEIPHPPARVGCLSMRGL
jgi:hypothetical protein